MILMNMEILDEFLKKLTITKAFKDQITVFLAFNTDLLS